MSMATLVGWGWEGGASGKKVFVDNCLPSVWFCCRPFIAWDQLPIVFFQPPLPCTTWSRCTPLDRQGAWSVSHGTMHVTSTFGLRSLAKCWYCSRAQRLRGLCDIPISLSFAKTACKYKCKYIMEAHCQLHAGSTARSQRRPFLTTPKVHPNHPSPVWQCLHGPCQEATESCALSCELCGS